MSDNLEENLDDLRTTASLFMKLIALVAAGFLALLHAMLAFAWGGVLALWRGGGWLESATPLLRSWEFARFSVGIPFLVLAWLFVDQYKKTKQSIPDNPEVLAVMGMEQLKKETGGDDYEYREKGIGDGIRESVKKMAAKAKVPVPRIFWCSLDDMNAFANVAGNGQSLIVLLSKVTKCMRPEWVNAIAAHELGHIVNGDAKRDILLRSLAGALGRIFDTGLVLFQLKTRECIIGRPDDEPVVLAALKASMCFVAGLALMAVGWLPWTFAKALAWWREYFAEYLADATGAWLVGNARLMADSLVALQVIQLGVNAGSEKPVHLRSSLQRRSIGDTLSFDEHPPTVGRIRRLWPGFDGDWESAYKASLTRRY